MKELKKIEELAVKTEMLRKKIEIIMKEFQEKTLAIKNENLMAEVFCGYFIKAGSDDLHYRNGEDYDRHQKFFLVMGSDDLLLFIENFPIALKKLEKKIEEKIKILDEKI
jgi:hypothetical protein